MVKIFKNIVFTNLLFGLLLCAVVVPILASADTIQPIEQTVKLKNPIKSDTLQEFAKMILEGIIKIGIPILVLAVIYSGFLFVTAQGKPAEIEQAQNNLKNVLLGAAILFGAWGLAQLVTETVKAL